MKSHTKENIFFLANSAFFLGGLACLILNYKICSVILFLLLALVMPIFSRYAQNNAILPTDVTSSQEDLPSETMNFAKNQAASNKEALLEDTIVSLKAELKSLTTLQQETKSMLSQSESQLHRFTTWKDSLLPLSFPEETPYDVVTFVRNHIRDMHVIFESKRIHSEILCDQDIMAITANNYCLSLILQNVLDNAIKYLPNGGKINLTISELDGMAFLILRDSGLGCVIEDTNKLFDLNFQGTNKRSGNGLGLAQTKAAVLALGGNIWCKTSPDRGFGVYIQLPMANTLETVAGKKEETL